MEGRKGWKRGRKVRVEGRVEVVEVRNGRVDQRKGGTKAWKDRWKW